MPLSSPTKGIGSKSVLLYAIDSLFTKSLLNINFMATLSEPLSSKGAENKPAKDITDQTRLPGGNGDVAPLNLVIIRGQTTAEKKFRPSDWCDRLYGTLRALGDDAEEVSEYVHLVNYNGEKCILLDKQLEEVNMYVYRFFIHFAHDNNLCQEEISQQHWDSLHT